MTDLKHIGKSILKKVQQRSGLEAEVYLTHSKHTSISVLDQKIEELKDSEEQGLSIRILGKDRMGFAYTSDLSEKALDECLNKALVNHEHNAKDAFWSIAANAPLSFPELGIYDQTLAALPIADKIELAMSLEKAARGFDRRVTKTEQASYFDTISSCYLLNSLGLDLDYQATYCGGLADIIAEENTRMESGNALDFAVKLGAFDPKKIGAQAAEQACQLLGAGTPNTAKADLVLPPEVGVQFLALLASLFLASSVQKGKSLLAGRLGTTIANEKVCLTDDGLLPGHLGSAPFDGEGTPSQRTILVKNGVLQSYLHNLYTAGKAKARSTGNALRSSFFSLPEVAPSNFYLEPGPLSRDAIIQKAGQGIYLTKVMGMHTANPISGDFSVGIAGLMIENGRLSRPIRGGAIAGNLLGLLNSIQEIGSDLRFLPLGGNIGCPTLLIKGISVSGS